VNIGTETKQNLVPHFVRARTAQALIEAMFENNLRERSEIKYSDIAFSSQDQYWYAWFYKTIDGFAKIKAAK
jgi:hypothetical protein